jgi:hypothetical protein
MIRTMRVGMTVVCSIREKLYKKTFNSDDEMIALYEQALNTDENDPDDLAALILAMTPPKTDDEIKLEAAVEEEKEQLDLIAWMESLKDLNDPHFEVVGTKLYMKGINITIPEFLAAEFARRRNDEEDVTALMNFWRRCALNPDPRCREDLYKFLINTKMTVTPSGYFVAYRNANIKSEGDRALNEFVATQYAKIKAHKKGPRNFDVYIDEDDDYLIIHTSKEDIDEELCFVGNLQKLYEDLGDGSENQTVYTDAHSRTTTIIIGKPVKIDRSDCDANPDRTCSKGLHLGSTNFMTRGYFGSVGLICLCDPMDVVAVPYSDGQKLRTSEYLPIAVAEYGDDDRIIPVDTATFEYDYAKYDQEELEEMLKNTNLESLKEHDIIPKEISLIALRLAISGLRESLDEMTQVVKERNQNV